MKKWIALLIICSIPCFIFLNVWQVFTFDSLRTEVETLEEEQKEWFEENKKMIVGIEYLNSPYRVDKIAREKLELNKITSDRIIQVRIVKEKGSQDG